ncbi:MFS transporter [Inquilinus sp. Marseille-Q2685]|uniref:CynX/NimT family MFS transporter n=1 Tax=Inquilinus sp. Marseille-Q2685 TaxID=2866581 RepID=UPI001CE483A1|nr:MFS transporter [Inquilinus sp. Marseille-Q2685]
MVSTAEPDRDDRAVPSAHVPHGLADELLIDAEVDDIPAPTTPLKAGWLLVVSLVLIALNLRPALSSLGPVLKEIIADTGISAGTASLLTTAPVVCLGLFGVLAPRISRRLGTERAVLALLLVLALGTALRGLGTPPALLLGAILAGAGIGVTNVLLPGIVKRDFPDRAPLMTGVYTMALCAGAALAAGATLPIAQAADGSWAAALAFWAIPAIIAALVWLTQIPPRHGPAAHAGFTVRGLWSDPLAWQVTLFMGLQSSLAYSVFGWLAPILRDRGVDGVAAGIMVSVSIMVQVAAALVAPSLATRGRDQRLAALLCMAFSLVGFLGCIFAPLGTVWLWIVLLGIGQGAAFAVALTLVVLRTPDAHVAAHLSSMSQGVGYTLASGGPLLIGLLHDWTGGWAAAGLFVLAIGLAAALAGIGAGRAKLVSARAVAR